MADKERPVGEKPSNMTCVHCGLPSGPYDEHLLCSEGALLAELEADSAGQQDDDEVVEAYALCTGEFREASVEGGRHA